MFSVFFFFFYTLGPAGPPLQRGVLEVPQSAQVFLFSFTWLLSSSDEAFLFPSSESVPCIQTQSHQLRFEWLNQNSKTKMQKYRYCNWSLTFSLGSNIFTTLFKRSNTDPVDKTRKHKWGVNQNLILIH